MTTRSVTKIILRYSTAALFVLISSIASEVFYRLTGSSRLSSIFLAGVLLSAFVLGSGPSYFATALAFLAYLFLVDPRYQFSFGSPDDFNTLFVFTVVAVLTGLLTGRVRDQAARAEARARATSALLDATRDFSASSDEQFIRSRLAHHLAAAAKGSAVVQEGMRILSAPDETIAGPVIIAGATLERAAREGFTGTRMSGDWSLRPLRVGEAVFGVAAWELNSVGLAEKEERPLLEILSDTGAAAIARARLASAQSEAQARAKTEDLRNALLSSISHDLRTPLAAIIASATSLQEFGHEFDESVRHDLLSTIHEEGVRLDAFVANLLNMTKLESGALTVQRVAFSLPEVAGRVAQRLETTHRRPIATSFGEDVAAMGDPVLFEQALNNVVENALRYSPPGSIVLISCARGGDSATVQVMDDGHGVPQEDVERIFEKFYRAPNVGQSGTGLGLSISKGLIEGMGGALTAANRAVPDQGLVVTLALPSAS